MITNQKAIDHLTAEAINFNNNCNN